MASWDMKITGNLHYVKLHLVWRLDHMICWLPRFPAEHLPSRFHALVLVMHASSSKWQVGSQAEQTGSSVSTPRLKQGLLSASYGLRRIQ
jgi:hypothetical protein